MYENKSRASVSGKTARRDACGVHLYTNINPRRLSSPPCGGLELTSLLCSRGSLCLQTSTCCLRRSLFTLSRCSIDLAKSFTLAAGFSGKSFLVCRQGPVMSVQLCRAGRDLPSSQRSLIHKTACRPTVESLELPRLLSFAESEKLRNRSTRKCAKIYDFQSILDLFFVYCTIHQRPEKVDIEN
jgi:hypothetical protein